MNRKRYSLTLALWLCTLAFVMAQKTDIKGRVVSQRTGHPIEFASVLMGDNGLWAITDEKGSFTIKQAPTGKTTFTVQCLGYAKYTTLLDITEGMKPLTIQLKEENLQLEEVTVVAKRKDNEGTTAYTIDRTTLDNQQILTLGEIATLLPGGKTVNGSLLNDTRMALRAGSSEKGNASFGTAIEVDGQRLQNNAETGETLAASTRTVAASNIESVEIITGIASVEHGDLSNGIVKVKTRRGKSPFIVEGRLNPHTQQIAINKGFELGKRGGLLNASFEHARSFSNLVSPHTAYQRNVFSLNYMKSWLTQSMPLTLNVAINANVGGYNSEADPDQELDDYAKARDNNLRGNFTMKWLLNQSWITNVEMSGSFAVSDKLTENYASKSSASTQPYIHTTEEGYFIAQDFSPNTQHPTPNTQHPTPIILGPTGYWYVRGFNQSKPTSANWKLKGECNKSFSLKNESSIRNKLMAGAEWNATHNNGRGTYYEDMRYAPTWRPYRYDELPSMRNTALFIEDKLRVPLSHSSLPAPRSSNYISRSSLPAPRSSKSPTSLDLTAGLRYDITSISGSDYGTVKSFSPRFNSRLTLIDNDDKKWLSHLSIHAGWGKSVKLPSFQVLYPTPTYADRLAFASQSTSDNRSYYAYHTYPSKAMYNPDLHWQYTNQTDIGLEMTVAGTRISVSAYRHRTHMTYMSTDVYTPMTYRYTPPSSLEQCAIEVANRRYDVDQQTGVVTVSDITGQQQPVTLAYNERKTYTVNDRYVNGSPVERRGLEWIVDFARINSLHTQIRIDGNYYWYKGIDDVLFADVPIGINNTMSGGQLYQYIGYYRGSNVTSTNYSANAAIANGSLTERGNLNATVTTHIPKIRLILSLRLEYSFLNYSRQLSEFEHATRGIVLKDGSALFGTPYDGTTRDQFIALYPEYYSTWEEPDVLIPFAEKFLWAKDNDQTLFSDLSRLVVRANYAYIMNPSKISRYYSANLSVTKEIGDHISVSFYANNFFNNMKRISDSQTGTETSLFGSSYIPSFYYGLSLRIKI